MHLAVALYNTPGLDHVRHVQHDSNILQRADEHSNDIRSSTCFNCAAQVLDTKQLCRAGNRIDLIQQAIFITPILRQLAAVTILPSCFLKPFRTLSSRMIKGLSQSSKTHRYTTTLQRRQNSFGTGNSVVIRLCSLTDPGSAAGR